MNSKEAFEIIYNNHQKKNWENQVAIDECYVKLRKDLEMLEKLKSLFSMQENAFDKNSIDMYFNNAFIGVIENDETDDDNLLMIKEWLDEKTI